MSAPVGKSLFGSCLTNMRTFSVYKNAAWSFQVICTRSVTVRSRYHKHDGPTQATGSTATVSNNNNARAMCQLARKVDVTTGRQMLVFDTHAVIKRLQAEGMSESQAESLVDSLVQITQAQMDYVNRNMVTKPQQEIMMQEILAHLGAVRKDMIILEKSEFSMLKHEYEKQNIEIMQLRQTLKDELIKMKNGMSLDMNLERSRATEAHAENEKNLSTLDNRVKMDHSEMEKVTSMLDNKIDKEVAELLATYERYRNDIIKYAGGTIMTCLTICLGFYRLWA